MNSRYTNKGNSKEDKFDEIKTRANEEQNKLRSKGNGAIPTEPGKFDYHASIDYYDEHDYHGVPTSLKEQIQETLDTHKALELQGMAAQKKEQPNTANINTVSQNSSMNNNPTVGDAPVNNTPTVDDASVNNTPANNAPVNNTQSKEPDVIDTVKEVASIFKIPRLGDIPTLKPK